MDHVPQKYSKIQAQFKAESGVYDAIFYDPRFKKKEGNEEWRDDRIFDPATAQKILADVTGAEGRAHETRKESPRKPPVLFDLTMLQRIANSRFGWAATRTLRAAQRCYETHKVLTYPRTNSNALPTDYKVEVDRILNVLSSNETYGDYAKHLLAHGLKNEKRIFDDSQVSDHFAIIPTGEIRVLDGDDRKLFDLVVRQFLAAFYPPSVYEDVERTTTVCEYTFRSKPPKVLKEAGWEAVFGKEVVTGKSAFPPLVTSGAATDVPVTTEEIKAEENETKPPPRISEAGLLSLMENAGRHVEEEELAAALKNAEGLGTAATRADIIENLKIREYIDDTLRPTVKGLRLVDILHRIGVSRLTSAKLTAELELHLNEVERGERTLEAFMEEISSYTRDVVDATKNFDFESIYPNENPVGQCPRCHSPVFEKAWFYGCEEGLKKTTSKKCDFLVWKDNNGRYMNRAVVKVLLEKGETPVLDGFRSVSGANYKAILVIESGSVVRKQVDMPADVQDGGQGFEINADPIGKCPVHPAGDCSVIETSSEFICEKKKKAREDGNKLGTGFAFPRLLCKREVKREEVHTLIQDGETAFLNGFTSKRGRKFSAKLKLDDKGGVTFVFPERLPRRRKAAGEEGEATTSTTTE